MQCLDNNQDHTNQTLALDRALHVYATPVVSCFLHSVVEVHVCMFWLDIVYQISIYIYQMDEIFL